MKDGTTGRDDGTEMGCDSIFRRTVSCKTGSITGSIDRAFPAIPLTCILEISILSYVFLLGKTRQMELEMPPPL